MQRNIRDGLAIAFLISTVLAHATWLSGCCQPRPVYVDHARPADPASVHRLPSWQRQPSVRVDREA